MRAVPGCQVAGPWHLLTGIGMVQVSIRQLGDAAVAHLGVYPGEINISAGEPM